MGEHTTRADIREQTVTAIITRADGTVENLGQIAYYHRNPFLRWLGSLRNRKGETSK